MSEPLTPAECDVRGLPFMPLDVVRLLDSDLFALSTGDEFKAAVALWCRAWNQVPAASLPDDDRILAHLSAAGAKWKRVRDMALRGWVKCDDGRLYHPVIAAKAREAWEHRLRQRERSARGNAKRWGSPEDANGNPAGNPTGDAPRDPQRHPHGDRHTGSQGTGTVKGQGEPPIVPHRRTSPKPLASLAEFDRFWAAYPRREGKGAARKAWATATTKADPARIIEAARNANWPSDPRFIPHPATWLNQERWTDERPRNAVLSILGLDEPEPLDMLRLQ